MPAVVRFDPPGPWAQSTSGSAPRLQRDACRFEPGWVHHAGVAEMEDALGSDPGGLTPLRVRPSPPAPGASSSVVERWTLNPCRRGFEPLGAHSAGIIRSQHLVVAQFGQSTRFGTGGSAVRVRSTRPAVMQAPQHSGVVQRYGRSALDRETVVRIHLPEHRRGPVNASSCRSSSIGRAPPRQGGGNGIETRLWRQALVVKRMITGDYESPVPGSSPGRGASSS